MLLAALLTVLSQAPVETPLSPAPLPSDVPAMESEELAPPLTDAVSEREARWAERDARKPTRYLVEALGGTVGVALGSWGLMALGAALCDRSRVGTSTFCVPDGVTALAGVFVLPLGMYISGRLVDSPGGYWWAMLGSLPGWVLAEITFYFVQNAAQGKFNPASYLPFLLPVIPAALLFEWSADRDLRELEGNLPITRVVVIPGGPRGSVGVSMAVGF